MARKFLDPDQAAEYAGLSVATLATKRTRGGGPPYYKIAGKIRYAREDLDKWIEAQRRTRTTTSAISSDMGLPAL